MFNFKTIKPIRTIIILNSSKKKKTKEKKNKRNLFVNCGVSFIIIKYANTSIKKNN